MSRRRASQSVAQRKRIQASKSTHLARLGGLTVAGIALAGVVQPVGVAHAAPVDAITNVWVEATTVGYWDKLEVRLNWRVPNSAQPGDTFDIALPQRLVGDTEQPVLLVDPALIFPLLDTSVEGPPEDAPVVATARIVDVDGVQVVRFTLTDYAASHWGINGEAHFETSWNTAIVPPGGDPQTFTFTTNTPQTVTDTVSILPLDVNKNPGKWQSWVPDAPAPDRHLQWGLMGGEVLPAYLDGSLGTTTATFVDTPGAGQEIVCDSIQLVYLTYRDDGLTDWYQDRPLAPGEITCGPGGFTAKVALDPAMEGKGVQLYGWSKVTDYSLASYSNTGSVTLGPAATGNMTGTARRSSAGGSGSGTNNAVTVGDLVWLDGNHDGIQSAGENGIQGVVLTIAGPDGVLLTDATGNPLTTTTDANGTYQFTGLPTLASGQGYEVRIDTAAAGTQTALAGLLPTRTGAGTPGTDSST
ncbi:MAG: SdrD B-like domain-containing protein, partial [Propionibacteriaceae bacterium]|nr:SdrD B-like domain-containing protein [Propionibacteriaceae bacterium]